MVCREQLGNVTLTTEKSESRSISHIDFFTQPYGFVEGSLTLVFCRGWQYCQYPVISGSMFHRRDQRLKFYTKIKLLLDKMGVEIQKKENTLNSTCVYVQEHLFLNVPWKFFFCRIIYLSMCNRACTCRRIYIYILCICLCVCTHL